MSTILVVFIALKLVKLILETSLSYLNKSYYEDEMNQKNACQQLGISDSDFQKALVYSRDKFSFSIFSEWFQTILFILFLILEVFPI